LTNAQHVAKVPKVVIDLAKLGAADGPEQALLRRYVNMLRWQRHDFDGRVMTLRGEDVCAIAYALGITPDALECKLDHLDLRAGDLHREG